MRVAELFEMDEWTNADPDSNHMREILFILKKIKAILIEFQIKSVRQSNVEDLTAFINATVNHRLTRLDHWIDADYVVDDIVKLDYHINSYGKTKVLDIWLQYKPKIQHFLNQIDELKKVRK